MESLKEALKQLSVKGKVTAYPMTGDPCILVLLDNAYFGMWDSAREMFID